MQKDLLDQIKSGLLRELSDADEPQHRYHDPDTGREFGVRRFMGSDTLKAPMRTHYFLEEYTPNGRMVEVDARGHVTRAWDEPRIKALEARVGPNELMAALADAGINRAGRPGSIMTRWRRSRMTGAFRARRCCRTPSARRWRTGGQTLMSTWRKRCRPDVRRGPAERVFAKVIV